MSRTERVVAAIVVAVLLCVGATAAVFSAIRAADANPDAGPSVSPPTPTPSTTPESEPESGPESGPEAGPTTPAAGGRPNIVYILSDDLSMNLVPYMRNVNEMMAEGYTFTNFFTPNSQCCPSRAAIFTGQYGHNNGVQGNSWPDGGFDQYVAHGDEQRSLGVYLHDAGYYTSFMGKYLNGYKTRGRDGRPSSKRPTQARAGVPPGWDDWFGIDSGYREFQYHVATNDVQPPDVIKYGDAEDDYGVDVLSRRATGFLSDYAAGESDQPFLLYVASFSPHQGGRFPAAPRDRPIGDRKFRPQWATPDFANGDCGPVNCADVTNGETIDGVVDPRFNRHPANAPGWMPTKTLTAREIKKDQKAFVQRVQMVQSLDDLVGAVRAELASTGLADSTYLVFTSDNGFHLGEYGLRLGKQSAYDTDTHVPFVMVPPGGLPGGHTVDAFVSNVDITPTLADLAGVQSAMPGEPWDGASFVWALDPRAATPAGWAKGALLEHLQKGRTVGSDPDRDDTISPYTYTAVRTGDYLAVRYYTRDGKPLTREGEFYRLSSDPYMMTNLWKSLSPLDQSTLRDYLDDLGACAGSDCRDLLGAPPGVSSAAAAGAAAAHAPTRGGG